MHAVTQGDIHGPNEVRMHEEVAQGVINGPENGLVLINRTGDGMWIKKKLDTQLSFRDLSMALSHKI